jgi:signal transduction histidine kinase
MRERAELVGATLDIRSRSRDGTTVTVEVTSEERRKA